MTSLFSYLLTFMGIMYWIFRVIVVLLFQIDSEFFAQPLNTDYEIALLFLTIPCMILIVRRNIIGAAGYLGLYVAYFGTSVYESFLNGGFQTLVSGTNILCSLIGIVIPLFTFLDILLNKNRTLGTNNKKSDWFYANDKFDREYDERADKNQYKI